MRIKILACKVLMREISEAAAVSKNIADITWVRQGFHNEPDNLRAILQKNIDMIDSGEDPGTSEYFDDIEAIVLGYGLCSNGVTGVSSKKYKLVIPRAHDCISLFLGSKERYRELFDSMGGGAYWYAPGWIENAKLPCEQFENEKKEEYIEKYGEENAEYLLEMESGWYRDYKYLPYIIPHNDSYPDYREFTKNAAKYYDWEYSEHLGDISLIKDMVDGNWDEEKFLIVPPGQTAIQSYDEKTIIKTAD